MTLAAMDTIAIIGLAVWILGWLGVLWLARRGRRRALRVTITADTADFQSAVAQADRAWTDLRARLSDPERPVVAFMCGGAAADRCVDGGAHDAIGRMAIYGSSGKPCGESVACSKCGSSAFDRDLLRLP